MGDNVIGFIGSDKYEFILYLSRILYHLGKKVLMVDYSEKFVLSQCIPKPEKLNHKDYKDYIDYCGVDFIKGIDLKENWKTEYDVVLIDFGFHPDAETITYCTKLIYVTDLQLQNVNRMKSFLSETCYTADAAFVIKDVVDCKITPEFILEQLEQEFDENQTYILYQDSFDTKYRILCQYNLKYNFGRLSKPTKIFLKDLARGSLQTQDEKGLKEAYKKAERGK